MRSVTNFPRTTSRMLLGIATAVSLTVLSGLSQAVLAAGTPEVWFAPDNDTYDFVDLFRKPELWSGARSHISVLKFGTQQLGGPDPSGLNTLSDLSSSGAFRLLRSWNIKVALELPADCSVELTVRRAVNFADKVSAAGATLASISIAGPLTYNIAHCDGGFERAITDAVAVVSDLRRRAPELEVGDIESYPTERPADIERWVLALTKRGAKPAYLHLDSNVHFLDLHPEVNVASDFQSLRAFLHSQGIPFGIIFWSGYNPEPTDQSYYEHAMSWVRRVHAAVGTPDQIIFQSWVHRSFPGCSESNPDCRPPRLKCPSTDRLGCGLQSVPVNLPESNPFSHTMLIDEALRILR